MTEGIVLAECSGLVDKMLGGFEKAGREAATSEIRS
jgi:hypothetical protein